MQGNIFKSSMIYGLMMGILFSVNFIISIPQSSVFRIISFLITILIVVVMYRYSVKFRDNECGGSITYGKSFSFIVLTFFFASIISAIVKFVYFQFINPEYLTNVLHESMKVVESLNLPLDEEYYTQIEKMMKPSVYTLQSIWVNVLLGVLLALVMSAFVKKDNDIFEE